VVRQTATAARLAARNET